MTCLLCEIDEGTIADPPAEFADAPRPFYYLHGFADGVRAAQAGIGPKLCERHRHHCNEALKARGLRAMHLPPGGVGHA